MNNPIYIEKMNALSKQRVPFIFIIDYTSDHAVVKPLDDLNPEEILYSIDGFTNSDQSNSDLYQNPVTFKKYPIGLNQYEKSFNLVKENLQKGNSYLTNLTCETPIETNLSLKEIFYRSSAPFKLWFKNQFVVFSPEIFVQIKDGKIMSFPMKGTIDASIPDAENKIMEDKKEKAEHATIVDLIRNDLSKVATHIKVDNYRYVDRIKNNQAELLQVSSKISGELPHNYHENLGNIFHELLPAGSISGAPKIKTMEIIEEAEKYDRGFYTGVFGIFDGTSLDSAVLIRFIENKNGKLVYKSGGGITVNSELENEYNEMIQKVYLPI